MLASQKRTFSLIAGFPDCRPSCWKHLGLLMLTMVDSSQPEKHHKRDIHPKHFLCLKNIKVCVWPHPAVFWRGAEACRMGAQPWLLTQNHPKLAIHDVSFASLSARETETLTSNLNEESFLLQLFLIIFQLSFPFQTCPKLFLGPYPSSRIPKAFSLIVFLERIPSWVHNHFPKIK